MQLYNAVFKYLLVIFMCTAINAQYQKGSGFAGLPFDLSHLSPAERKDAFSDIATNIFQLIEKYFIKKDGQIIYATDNAERNGIAEGMFNLLLKIVQIDDLDNFQRLTLLSQKFSDENGFKQQMLRFRKDKKLKKLLFYTWMYEFMTNPEFHAFYTPGSEQLINSEIIKTERILNFIKDEVHAPVAFKKTLRKRIAYLKKQLSDMESKRKQDSESPIVQQKPKKTVPFDDEPKIVEFDPAEPIVQTPENAEEPVATTPEQTQPIVEAPAPKIIEELKKITPLNDQTEPIEITTDLVPAPEEIPAPVIEEKATSQVEAQSVVPGATGIFGHLTDDQLREYVIHNRLDTGEKFADAARRLGGAAEIQKIRQNYLKNK